MDNVMDVEQRALSLAEQAPAFRVIATADEYAKVGAFLVAIKDVRKELGSIHKPKVAIEHQRHQAALDEWNRLDGPLEQIEKFLVKPMNNYLAEEKRQREALTRIAQEAARKAEEDARLLEAEAMEKAGEHAEAEAIIQAPVVVPSVVVPREVPKVAGMASRTVWKYRILDLARMPKMYWELDEAKVNRQVQNLKKLAEIPGVLEVYSEEEVRGARR